MNIVLSQKFIVLFKKKNNLALFFRISTTKSEVNLSYHPGMQIKNSYSHCKINLLLDYPFYHTLYP